MPSKLSSLVARVRAGRVRILWLVLGALLLVSALPIGLYHRQVLHLSQEKLVDTERIQQTELTDVVGEPDSSGVVDEVAACSVEATSPRRCW